MTLDVGLIFKIGAAGILIVIINNILKSSGKDDVALVTNMAGIIIILIMVINLIGKLFNTVKAMFQF